MTHESSTEKDLIVNLTIDNCKTILTEVVFALGYNLQIEPRFFEPDVGGFCRTGCVQSRCSEITNPAASALAVARDGVV